MAQRKLNSGPDRLTEFTNGPAVDALERSLWVAGAALRDSGIISTRDFDLTEVSRRRQVTGKISELRRPVSLVAANKPDFVINGDVYRSHLTEFDQTMQKTADGLDVQKIAENYSSLVAWGELALRQAIVSPTYSRSPKRLKAISDLLTDREDFTSHFKERHAGSELSGLMSRVDDSAMIQVNGLRAGLTIVRAGLQDEGMDPITDDVVLAANAALEEYVGKEGPYYVDTATNYLNLSAEYGVSAFSYAVPE